MTKFVMAFFVILIHVCILAESPPPSVVEWFMNLAVPFFFIASGWFLGRKMQAEPSVRPLLKNRILALVKLWALWVLIYMPLTVNEFFERGGDESLFRYVLWVCYSLLTQGESVMSWPLWFLHAVIVGCIVLYIVADNRRALLAIFAVLICNTIAVWLDGRYGFMPNIITEILAQRVFGGIMLFLTGILAARAVPAPAKPLAGVACLALSVALFYLEAPFWQMAGGMALFMLSMSVNPVSTKAGMWFRNQSMWIYYMHMYVLVALFAPSFHLAQTIGLPHGSLLNCAILGMAFTMAITSILGLLDSRTPMHRFLGVLIK